MGVVGRGGTATGTVKVYNTGNDSALDYEATPQGAMNFAVSPSGGSIPAKSNTTLTLTANVPESAKQGSYNGTLLVRATSSSATGVVVLPALAAKVTLNVEGTAQPAATAPDVINTPLAVLIAVVALLVLSVVSYLALRRRR